MSFMTWIVEDLNAASDFFYSLYREVLDWTWPFWYAAEFFYSLSRVFNGLAWDFATFAEWVTAAASQLENILSWSSIRSLILGWLPDLEAVVDWWQYWGYWIIQEFDAWWDTTWIIVQGFIAIATEGLATLLAAWSDFWAITFPQWTAKLDNIKADWDNFWVVILPTLVNFTWLTTWWDSQLLNVQLLIESTILLWFPFYSSLTQLWNSIEEFFADPEDWLYKAIDRIIERFW